MSWGNPGTADYPATLNIILALIRRNRVDREGEGCGAAERFRI
jgi:hypothetical protein